MESREKYEYWLETAKYDLESAKVMYSGGRYMYVIFMSQQAIEKITKGIYTLYTDKEAPLTHNIWNIFKQLTREVELKEFLDIGEFENRLKENRNFFLELLSFYISGRYPSYKEKISGSIDKKKAGSILKKTEEVFIWIESLNQFKG